MEVNMLASLLIVFALTFVCESFIEYVFGTLFNKIPKIAPYKWTLMYLAMAAGVGLAFYYKIDIISMLPPGSAVTTLGIVLSGLIMGRGSNFLHQLVSQFFPSPK